MIAKYQIGHSKIKIMLSNHGHKYTFLESLFNLGVWFWYEILQLHEYPFVNYCVPN